MLPVAQDNIKFINFLLIFSLPFARSSTAFIAARLFQQPNSACDNAFCIGSAFLS